MARMRKIESIRRSREPKSGNAADEGAVAEEPVRGEGARGAWERDYCAEFGKVRAGLELMSRSKATASSWDGLWGQSVL